MIEQPRALLIEIRELSNTLGTVGEFEVITDQMARPRIGGKEAIAVVQIDGIDIRPEDFGNGR